MRDVARGVVEGCNTKADAMAANTSSFAIIFALCMMAVNRAGMGADRLLSAAAQIKPIPKTTDRFAAYGVSQAIFCGHVQLASINALEAFCLQLQVLHASICGSEFGPHTPECWRTNRCSRILVFERAGTALET